MQRILLGLDVDLHRRPEVPFTQEELVHLLVDTITAHVPGEIGLRKSKLVTPGQKFDIRVRLLKVHALGLPVKEPAPVGEENPT